MALLRWPSFPFATRVPSNIENDTAGKLRRIVVDIVRRRDFHHLHAAQSFARNGVDHFERFSGQQAAGLRRARSGSKTRID